MWGANGARGLPRRRYSGPDVTVTCKNAWRCATTSLQCFMAWCLINEEKFSFGVFFCEIKWKSFLESGCDYVIIVSVSVSVSVCCCYGTEQLAWACVRTVRIRYGVYWDVQQVYWDVWETTDSLLVDYWQPTGSLLVAYWEHTGRLLTAYW